MPSKVAKESALDAINGYKAFWNKADGKYQTYKFELETYQQEQYSSSSSFDAKKLYRKIQDLKQRVSQEKFKKDSAKAEIEILEVQTWKQSLTDPGEDSIDKIKDTPKKENEQNLSAHSKKKLLYA